MEQPLKVAPAGTEGSLLAQVRAGDEQAFAALVSSLFPAVFQAAMRILRQEQEAEDVAQEVFLKIWRDPPELRNEDALKGWSMRVASNGAIDRLRKKRPELAEELPERVDPGAGAESAMRGEQAQGAVQQVLGELPERQRLALVLTYYQGLPNKEAADLLNVSVDALVSLLARARRALKTKLSDQWQGLLEDLAVDGQRDGSWQVI